MTDYGLRAIAEAIKLIARAIIIAALLSKGYGFSTTTDALKQLEAK